MENRSKQIQENNISKVNTLMKNKVSKGNNILITFIVSI